MSLNDSKMGKDFDPELCFDELLMYYQGRDKQVWNVDYDEPNLKQSRCFIEGRPVLMMKARTTLKSSPQALSDVAIKFDIRT